VGNHKLTKLKKKKKKREKFILIQDVAIKINGKQLTLTYKDYVMSVSLDFFFERLNKTQKRELDFASKFLHDPKSIFTRVLNSFGP
jgi:hypothetical protein